MTVKPAHENQIAKGSIVGQTPMFFETWHGLANFETSSELQDSILIRFAGRSSAVAVSTAGSGVLGILALDLTPGLQGFDLITKATLKDTNLLGESWAKALCNPVISMCIELLVVLVYQSLGLVRSEFII